MYEYIYIMSTSKETVSKPRNKTKKRERGVGIYMKNAIVIIIRQ